MDKETQDILYEIPEGADVADASELDVEDVPQYRIQALIKFLKDDTDNTVKFFAARLLASWGLKEGFNYLVFVVNNKVALKMFCVIGFMVMTIRLNLRCWRLLVILQILLIKVD